MHFEGKTVRKAINKAFLKEPVERGAFDQFKEALGKLLNGIEQANEAGEREEHFKNVVKITTTNLRFIIFAHFQPHLCFESLFEIIRSTGAAYFCGNPTGIDSIRIYIRLFTGYGFCQQDNIQFRQL